MGANHVRVELPVEIPFDAHVLVPSDPRVEAVDGLFAVAQLVDQLSGRLDTLHGLGVDADEGPVICDIGQVGDG